MKKKKKRKKEKMGYDYSMGCIGCKRFVTLGKFRYSENMFFFCEEKYKRFCGLHSIENNRNCKLIFGGDDDHFPWYDDEFNASKNWYEDIISRWKSDEWKTYDSTEEVSKVDIEKEIQVGCLKCKDFVVIDNKVTNNAYDKDFEHLFNFLCLHKMHDEIIVHLAPFQNKDIPWSNKLSAKEWTMFEE